MAKGLDHDRRAQRDPGSPPDGACAPSTWGGDVEWGREGEVGAGRAARFRSAVVVLGSINDVSGRYLRSDCGVGATARKHVLARDESWILDHPYGPSPTACRWPGAPAPAWVRG